MNNAQLVANFIEQVWNQRDFSELTTFLHPDFIDHGLPHPLPANAEGTKRWIELTGMSFEHKTVIDSQVTEGDKSLIKIRMLLRHIGAWRDIAPTGLEVKAVGYRQFRLQDSRIIEHWALIDGQAIENQLRDAAQGCKAAE